jgi:hypothetical protein
MRAKCRFCTHESADGYVICYCCMTEKCREWEE